MHIQKAKICSVRWTKVIGKLLFHKGKSHLAHVLLRSAKVVGDFPYTLCVEECSLSQRRKRKTSFPYSSANAYAYAALVYHVCAKVEKGPKKHEYVWQPFVSAFLSETNQKYSMNGTTLSKHCSLPFSLVCKLLINIFLLFVETFMQPVQEWLRKFQ